MLLDTILDNQTWIFLQSFYKLAKKDKIKVLKKGDTYRIDIIDLDQATNSEMENIKNVMTFIDNLYNSDFSIFNNILEMEEDDNEKFVLFLRDIKKADLNIILSMYEIITKKKHLIDSNSFKSKFYDFIKKIYTVDLNIKNIINDSISFKPNTELSIKDKQSIKIIIIIWIIFANYYNTNKKQEYKYISRIDNFFTDKYEKFLYMDIDMNNYISYLINFIVNFIKNIQKNKEIGKTWLFSVLTKVSIVNKKEYQSKKKDVKTINEWKNLTNQILNDLKNLD